MICGFRFPFKCGRLKITKDRKTWDYKEWAKIRDYENWPLHNRGSPLNTGPLYTGSALSFFIEPARGANESLRGLVSFARKEERK